MSDWKVAESLVDWLNVTEYDGVLTTENANVAENEDALVTENVSATKSEDVTITENTNATEHEDSITEQEDVPAIENISPALFLTGESFLSHCWLPDVKPNTKILGICGITDWNEENDPKLPGAAAPNREGWHFADFYLFHHMLKEVASDQVWLTCVSPETAVEKYGRYVYGDYSPKKVETRRVVLEESKLCELNDVKTVSPESLLDTALATISKTCIEATAEGRPVLILVFSRGTQPDYSIVIGGEDGDDTKLLTRESFREAIGSQAPEAGLCLLATEYHTGAWAINPDMKVAHVASQGKYFEHLAWPISGTIHKRPCGPEFAYAISDMLLRLNIEGFVANIRDGERGADYDEYDEKLHDVVEYILKEIEFRDLSLFSGDDEWETEYSERAGIHISEFYRRYLLLKDATFGYDELLAAFKSQAETYFNSFPGPNYKSSNLELHTELRRVMKGTIVPSFIRLEQLLRQVDYRLEHMKRATEFKDRWDLTMKNCEDVQVEIGGGIGTNRWYQIVQAVQNFHLFDHPCDQGLEYGKGEWYIAFCIHSQGWDDTEMTEKIGDLVRYKMGCPTSRSSRELIVFSKRQQVRSFSDDQEFSALKREAKQYFDSKQREHDRASDNSIHGSLRTALGERRGRDSDPAYVRARADYRLNEIMGAATLYKDFLDIDYPGCHEVDIEKFWHCSETIGRRIDIYDFISTYPLFNSHSYYPYLKGKVYLSQCMSLQTWSKSKDETIAKLDSLVQYRESPTCPLYDWGTHLNPDYSYSGVPAIKGASRALETINQFRLSRHEDIRPIIWKFAEITNGKLLSLPPNNCRRKHLLGNRLKRTPQQGLAT